MIDLGLDTDVRVANVTTAGTGWRARIGSVFLRLLGAANPFGPAATTETGTVSGALVKLDGDGRIPVALMPATGLPDGIRSIEVANIQTGEGLFTKDMDLEIVVRGNMLLAALHHEQTDAGTEAVVRPAIRPVADSRLIQSVSLTSDVPFENHFGVTPPGATAVVEADSPTRGEWVSAGIPLPRGESSPAGLAFDPTTGDLLLAGRTTTRIYRYRGGAWDAGILCPLVSGVRRKPGAVVVDAITGAIIAAMDKQAPTAGSPFTQSARLHRYSGGAWDGGFAVPGGLGGASVTGLAIEPATGDVLAVQHGAGISRAAYGSGAWTSAATRPAVAGVAEILPGGLAVDTNGDVLLVGSTHDRLYRYSGGAWDMGLNIPVGQSAPTGITVESDGQIILVGVTPAGIARYSITASARVTVVVATTGAAALRYVPTRDLTWTGRLVLRNGELSNTYHLTATIGTPDTTTNPSVEGLLGPGGEIVVRVGETVARPFVVSPVDAITALAFEGEDPRAVLRNDPIRATGSLSGAELDGTGNRTARFTGVLVGPSSAVLTVTNRANPALSVEFTIPISVISGADAPDPPRISALTRAATLEVGQSKSDQFALSPVTAALAVAVYALNTNPDQPDPLIPGGPDPGRPGARVVSDVVSARLVGTGNAGTYRYLEITGVRLGIAIVEVTATSGTHPPAVARVLVTVAPPPPPDPTISGLNNDPTAFEEGSARSDNFRVSPTDARVTITVADTSVVRSSLYRHQFDTTGRCRVTWIGVSPGSTTAVVRVENRLNAALSIEETVNLTVSGVAPPAETPVLGPLPATLDINRRRTIRRGVTVTPSRAALSAESSDTSILRARIETSGASRTLVVTGAAVGSATVTVTATLGTETDTGRIAVTVAAVPVQPTAAKLANSHEITVGKSIADRFTVTPVDAIVTVSVGDGRIASSGLSGSPFDGSGARAVTFSGRAAGFTTATLLVKNREDTSLTRKFSIQLTIKAVVPVVPAGVRPTISGLTRAVRMTRQLYAVDPFNVSPSGSTVKATAAAPGIVSAYVQRTFGYWNLVMTAHKVGVATIKVTATNGLLTRSSTVTVLVASLPLPRPPGGGGGGGNGNGGQDPGDN